MFTVTPLARKNTVTFSVKPLVRNNVTVAQAQSQARAEYIKSLLNENKSYAEAIRSWDTKARNNGR